VITNIAEMVDQNPALDTAGLGAAQRLDDGPTNCIIRKHEVLKVDVGFGRLDILHNAIDGAYVVRKQFDRVAGQQGHTAELKTETDEWRVAGWDRWINEHP
jgi:hypothetical protein